LVKFKKKNKPLLKSKKDKILNNKFITMDLETRIIDGIHNPYLLSWYDGIKARSYFINDFKDFKELLQNVFNSLAEYNDYTIYFHNFSKFDSYFLVLFILWN
jgi:hypothetical protein